MSDSNIWDQLVAPFRPDTDVLWVVNNADKNGNWVICSPYIKKESAERRADKVLGPQNWEPEITWPNDTGFFFYTLWFRLSAEDEWRRRTVSGQISTGGFGEGEEFNIEVSFAEKRAWRMLGIGRYLSSYSNQFADHVQTQSDPNLLYYKPKNGPALYFRPPKLPPRALPDGFEYKSGNASDRGGKGTKKGEAQEIEGASDSQWKKIENYLDNIQDKQTYDKWVNALYREDVDDDGVVHKERKNIPAPKAAEIITKLKFKYPDKENKNPESKNDGPELPEGKPDGKQVAENAYGDTQKGEPED